MTLPICVFVVYSLSDVLLTSQRKSCSVSDKSFAIGTISEVSLFLKCDRSSDITEHKSDRILPHSKHHKEKLKYDD